MSSRRHGGACGRVLAASPVRLAVERQLFRRNFRRAADARGRRYSAGEGVSTQTVAKAPTDTVRPLIVVYDASPSGW
jgi:hypothetical protein